MWAVEDCGCPFKNAINIPLLVAVGRTLKEQVSRFAAGSRVAALHRARLGVTFPG